jgi:hypothetical protein
VSYDDDNDGGLRWEAEIDRGALFAEYERFKDWGIYYGLSFAEWLRLPREPQWEDMTGPEIEAFMAAHPTFCMTPKQASDWNAPIEAAIRRDLNKYHDPAQWPSDWTISGGRTYFRGVRAENDHNVGPFDHAGRKK